MKHTLADLTALFGLSAPLAYRPSHPASRPSACRNVVMRITLDSQHVTPLRQALIRDCAGQPWTIRVTPLHGSDRVRLVLYLPKSALEGAMQCMSHLVPTAEIAQLLEVPDTPTDAWTKVMHPPALPHGNRHGQSMESARDEGSLVHLLTDDHVLLNLEVADRDSLFARLGSFLEQRHGIMATAVVAGLAAREALGSTALGQGVAVPHGQISGLHGAIALYVRSVMPIPFDAPDGKPVTDLVVLFVPQWANATHLHLLAEVAERFCDQRFREQLHACQDAHAVCTLFAEFEPHPAFCRL
jgi:nitrogen PTS system EIIA component